MNEPAGISQLREQFRRSKQALQGELASSGASTRGIHRALHALAELTDTTLRELWTRAGMRPRMALVAVGGYGRGELFPCSDVDVLVLLPDGTTPESDPQLKHCIEAFIGSCWDTGVEIGSSVRSLSECVAEAERDVTVQTALLESRRVVGDARLYSAFRTAQRLRMDPKAFFVAKTLEMRKRHDKFENTPYALEPNCKESPGGLRDLQVLLWVAKAAGFGDNWDALARKGIATAFEVRQIKRNEALLRLIRARLHLLSGRREDRLVFDLQTAVAQSFGYTERSTAPGAPRPARTAPKGHLIRASEVLMRRYYWVAKAVTQLNQILLMNMEELLDPSSHEARPINARFNDKAGMLDVAGDDLYQREPSAILETFRVFQTTVGIKGLSSRTLRALYNARSVMDGKFRADPVNHAAFRRIMMEHDGLTRTLRLMNGTSVLGRYLWVFRRIVGQMQHDLFHVYTVDQHILTVVRNVRRFFIAEHAHEYPFCSQLAAGWDRPWVLYIAALFHDIAKGRGGDHSTLGADDARRFCRVHGFDRDDSQLIEFLVREHLTMSHTAQKSDLTDPDVIHAFARRVGSQRSLIALYLLTVADIRGTSPKVWNAWKGKLLEDLFRLTSRVLGGGVPDPHAEVEARKRAAMAKIALHAQPADAHKVLWETLDLGYFMRHDASEIAWHTRKLSRLVGSDNPVVRTRCSPVGDGAQVLVYARDRPDLFARICGYFERNGFSILDARVHTARNGFALDTFQVATGVPADGIREVAAMIENGLVQAINSDAPMDAPGKGRVSRRVRSFPMAPRVTLRPDEKAQRWLLNITASDRVGLLYSVAQVLARHKINLQLAKIATLGERVDDTFLIDGPGLQYNQTQIEVETELMQALA